MEKLKIAKLISMSGFCSRRDAEKFILEGRVKINGETITNVAERFYQDTKIEIDGKLLNNSPTPLLYLFYKPVECITSKSDPSGRKTIFDILPKTLPHLISVGRLDFYSEGALLLTNNGSLATILMSPKNHVPRTYKVKVYGNLPSDLKQKLEQGIEIEGIQYQPIQTSIISDKDKKHHILKLTLYEGKNREIRNICKFFNLKIDKLVRIEYAGISISGMKPTELKKLDNKVIDNIFKNYSKNID